MTELPNPTPQEVALWLKQMDREKAHDGWIEVNRRFPGITRALRPFLTEEFANDKERQAAFDGLSLALLTIAHFVDIEAMSALLAQPSVAEQVEEQKALSKTDKTPDAS